jgi:pimeloyl-ACP methyl ester carboxylesterase
VLRRTFVALVGVAGTALATRALASAQADTEVAAPAPSGEMMTKSTPQTGYAPVNGLQMYYEIHGAGEPLLLIHGAYATIDMGAPVLTALAKKRQVIAIEFQGHGHTADIDRPFSFPQLADDMAALLEYLDIPQADVVGYSMGGTIGLQLAMRHPDNVRKLVAISANYRSDGYYPEVLAGIQQISPEVFAGSPAEAAYLQSAPHPEDWPNLITKLKALAAAEFAWPEEEVRGITAPTLVMIGDSDVVLPEHAVALFRLLGGGVPGDLTGLPSSQLAILPGKTHITMVEEPTDLLLAMIGSFLDAPMPETR